MKSSVNREHPSITDFNICVKFDPLDAYGETRRDLDIPKDRLPSIHSSPRAAINPGMYNLTRSYPQAQKSDHVDQEQAKHKQNSPNLSPKSPPLAFSTYSRIFSRLPGVAPPFQVIDSNAVSGSNVPLLYADRLTGRQGAETREALVTHRL